MLKMPCLEIIVLAVIVLSAACAHAGTPGPLPRAEQELPDGSPVVAGPDRAVEAPEAELSGGRPRTRGLVPSDQNGRRAPR